MSTFHFNLKFRHQQVKQSVHSLFSQFSYFSWSCADEQSWCKISFPPSYYCQHHWRRCTEQHSRRYVMSGMPWWRRWSSRVHKYTMSRSWPLRWKKGWWIGLERSVVVGPPLQYWMLYAVGHGVLSLLGRRIIFCRNVVSQACSHVSAAALVGRIVRLRFIDVKRPWANVKTALPSAWYFTPSCNSSKKPDWETE